MSKYRKLIVAAITVAVTVIERGYASVTWWEQLITGLAGVISVYLMPNKDSL
jgi:hypothetical protein